MRSPAGNRLAAVVCAVLLVAWTPALAREDAGGAGPHEGVGLPVDVTSVASSRVLIWFDTVPGSAPFTGVELWYTSDRAQSWHPWTPVPSASGGGSSARPTTQGPIAFDAESDGLYGFYLVLHNAAGPSAAPPEPDTAPQTWVRVDRSAPMVQVLAFRADKHFESNREIHVRWTVRDDNLPDRPVKLHYRAEPVKAFRLLADLLPAEGSYRWTVPENVSGRVEVKVSATDRAGNTGKYVANRLRIDARTMRVVNDGAGLHGAGGLRARPGAGSAQVEAPEPSRIRWDDDPPAALRVVDRGAATRAQTLYDLGTWHRLRGEHTVAMLRYREALELNPGLLEARTDLGGLLFLRGRNEVAEREFKRVLAEDPGHTAALKSLALVQAMQHDYRSARETLEKLLVLDPADAEAWLHLGDVTLFMNDGHAAREAWRRAGAIETASAELKERAAKRLAIYKER